jgi:hypothetical protein
MTRPLASAALLLYGGARMPKRFYPLKLSLLMPLLGIFALALLLAGCDRCGDWIKSEGGNTPLVCKGDGPKP